MSEDTPEAQKEKTENAQEDAVKTETPPPEPPYGLKPEEVFGDVRAAIYKKSDAMRFPKPEVQETEEIPAEESKEESPPEAEPETKEAEAVEEEKPGKEEELTPREKRKAENLEAKEKRLSAWEKKLQEQFQAADKPLAVKTPDPSQTPLRYLTDAQFDEKYNELFSDSPAAARRFERNVEEARATASRETEEQRVESDFRDFRTAYPDVTESDWIQMNDPKFYEQYPDIIHAMNRRQHFATFVAARARLVEKKLSEELKTASSRQTAKEAELEKRTELKKKGTVLRVQTKVIQPTKKEEAPETPEQRKKRIVAEMVAASQERQGLGRPQT